MEEAVRWLTTGLRQELEDEREQTVGHMEHGERVEKFIPKHI